MAAWGANGINFTCEILPCWLKHRYYLSNGPGIAQAATNRTSCSHQPVAVGVSKEKYSVIAAWIACTYCTRVALRMYSQLLVTGHSRRICHARPGARLLFFNQGTHCQTAR